MTSRPFPGWRSPWMIVLAAAGLRAIVVGRTWEPADVWRGDPRTYAGILEALLTGRVDPAMWVWPPGFPALAIPFRIVLDTGAALHLVAGLAGVATVALLVGAGRRGHGGVPFAAAAFVYAFFPEAVLAACRPLPATVAILGSLGAAVGVEAAARSGRGRWAAAGGAAGATAILTRPETALSIPLFALVSLVGRRRAARPVLVYAAVVAALVAPYAIAFRGVSGAWGISIKPHLNILKLRVYEDGSDFAERRVLWDGFLDDFSDDAGNLDPRKIVEAVDPADTFLDPGIFRVTVSNFAYAFRRDPIWVNLLWILGLGGLLFGAGRPRERILAAALAIPVIPVATLFPPVERYALVAIPALGFGAGCSLVRFRAPLRRVPAAARIAAVVGLALLGASESIRQSRDFHWTGRLGEFLAEHRRGNDVEAEAILREAIRIDPSRPEPYGRLGTLLQERGDVEGALRAFRHALDRGGSAVPLAALSLRIGRRDAAQALLAPLRDAPPDTPDYWSLRGHLAMTDRDWNGAAECFARSAALGGPEDLLGLNRGMALLRAGRTAEATELLRRAAASRNPAVREAARTELERLETAPVR